MLIVIGIIRSNNTTSLVKKINIIVQFYLEQGKILDDRKYTKTSGEYMNGQFDAVHIIAVTDSFSKSQVRDSNNLVTSKDVALYQGPLCPRSATDSKLFCCNRKMCMCQRM